MSSRTILFGENEWYHIYNRGVDKRPTFTSESDAQKFQRLLYLCNNTERLDDIWVPESPSDVYAVSRTPLVDVGAYALMGNHYHLLLRQRREGGISSFMQKIGTGYTMYFNTRYERVGNLFLKPFRAKHVANDVYLQKIIDYIHLNPLERLEKEFKKGVIHDKSKALHFLKSYPFSSLIDLVHPPRPESSIVASSIKEVAVVDVKRVMCSLSNAVEYYSTLKM